MSNVGLSTGVKLASGASAWAAVSDRNAKENIRELDPEEVLARVEAILIYEYNYKGTDRGQLYRGPMAQDWHAAFPSDKDPLMIDTMDLDGVTIAAVKGLASIMREQANTIKELRERVASLECAALPDE